MKRKSIFFTFGFMVIVWACSLFTVSSKAGGEDLISGGTGIQVSGQEISFRQGQAEESEIAWEEEDEIFPESAFLVLNIEQGQQLLLDAYRDPEFQDDVVAFFGDFIGSKEIAEVILVNACAFDVPPALAFALCAEESRYNPRALNRNRNGTIDRGLFQLNNASFPQLAIDDFFVPQINARHGIAHLRWCLNTAGTEVAALAIYNAGATRVSSAGTPQSTLNYISRILRRQRDIEERFMIEYFRLVQERTVEIETIIIEPVKLAPFRLSLLAPLGR